jgi:hypothetical protein
MVEQQLSKKYSTDGCTDGIPDKPTCLSALSWPFPTSSRDNTLIQIKCEYRLIPLMTLVHLDKNFMCHNATYQTQYCIQLSLLTSTHIH